MILLQCGTVGLFASCGAVRYGLNVSLKMAPQRHHCIPRTNRCRMNHYNGTVFLISQRDDTQIGQVITNHYKIIYIDCHFNNYFIILIVLFQFILESLPRVLFVLTTYYWNYQNLIIRLFYFIQLILHIDTILHDTSIKIHYGFNSQHDKITFQAELPSLQSMKFLNWLGLGDRIVSGDMTAATVIMPREGGCQVWMDRWMNRWMDEWMNEWAIVLLWSFIWLITYWPSFNLILFNCYSTGSHVQLMGAPSHA